jgi:hypothetical protein
VSTSRRQWAVRIGTALGLWVAIVAAAGLLGNDPQPGLIALVVATGAGVLWLYLDASVQSEPAQWRLVDDDPVRPRGEDTRLALFQRVIAGHLDSRDTTDQLHRYIATVADQRLVTKHGISRLADPGRAAAVMGPELAGFLAHPRTRLSLNQIDHLLDRIEAL